MNRFIFLTALLTIVLILPVHSVPLRSISQLEERLHSIDEEMEQLAHYSLRSGVGSVGYRSTASDSPFTKEWLQLDWESAALLDQIVLVPCIWRDTKTGFRADGFPFGFRIIAGTSSDTNGTEVASFSAADHLLPRIAPLVINIQPIKASWIRLEPTELSPRAWDGKYTLQLAEILAFSKEENQALHATVTSYSGAGVYGNARKKKYVVDGFMPYLMDAYQGEQSIAYVGKATKGSTPNLRIDLGKSYPISRIHLHSVDLSDTIPQSTPADYGMPKHLIIQGANQPDFSDATQLVEYQMKSIYDTGPIIMFKFEEISCRYLRLIALKTYIATDGPIPIPHVGFAEIEIFSRGQNVALGKTFQHNFQKPDAGRYISALTDGRNLYGNILSIRSWLGELSRRHELEKERPLIETALIHRYAQQKTNLNRMYWIAALLAVGIGFTILFERLIQFRKVARIRERFAADLHDELGANVHTIGLLTDLTMNSAEIPDEWEMHVQRIRAITERTGKAIQYCTNMLEADGLFIGLSQDMQRAAKRIITNYKHDFSIEGEEFLDQLRARIRMDLFLFYKECLINICRHSGATAISTHLVATSKKLDLTITDNGTGISVPPKSLKRRARLLGAKISLENPLTGGTRIHLTFKYHWRAMLKPKRGPSSLTPAL